MRKIILVHGWDGKPTHQWHPWLKKELKKKGLNIKIPQMPNASKPEIKAWTLKLKKVAGKTDEDTILIGHSVGCQTVLRYLEKLPKKAKVGKCIFVAPWMHLDKQAIEDEGAEVIEIAKPWMKTPINWKKVRIHCKNFVCIFSDNDYYVPLSDSKLFRRKLNAKVIILKNKGHFVEYDKVFKLPELLKEILK